MNDRLPKLKVKIIDAVWGGKEYMEVLTRLLHVLWGEIKNLAETKK